MRGNGVDSAWYLTAVIISCGNVIYTFHDAPSTGNLHPRAPGVAAADYASTSSSLPLALPLKKIII